MPRHESNHLSVEEMRGWLLEETRNVLKESELRVREAAEFVTAYATNKLTPEEANRRLNEYDTRWSAALEGVYASSFKTDADIIAAIDKAHETRGGRLEKYARRSGLDKPPRSGRNR